MNTVRLLKSLGPIDIKSIRRDALLVWMIFLPVLIALLMRWGAPLLTARLLEEFQFDLSEYYPLLMSFVLLVMPLMTGMVIGFLLLDQRDDQTLTALQVTPLTLTEYLIYRTALPVMLSIMTTLLIFPVANLVATGFIHLLVAAVVAAPLAPLTALFLGTFAQNKVQGFALMKASGIIIYPPIIAYFVPGGWQSLFWIFPTYWPVKLYWIFHAGGPNAWFYVVLGLAFQAAIILGLLRRFNRIMTRS